MLIVRAAFQCHAFHQSLYHIYYNGKNFTLITIMLFTAACIVNNSVKRFEI